MAGYGINNRKMIIIFKLVRAIRYLNKKIRSAFWHWYNMQYCMANNVVFAERKSVQFNDHAIVSISPQADVRIGKAFVVNSGPEEGIGTSKSKITVASGAKLIIGDFTGISSTSILVRNSVVIGNYVNLGGGTYINDSNHHSTDWRDREDRKRDVDNVYSAVKFIQDALVKMGTISNDNVKNVIDVKNEIVYSDNKKSYVIVWIEEVEN